MGTLYKEMVEHKKHRGIRVILFLGAAVLIINLIILASSLKNIFEEFLFISYVLTPVAALGMAYIWRKYKTRYRYIIIDRELIIEKLNGNKKRTVLNINAKYILGIEKCKPGTQGKKICRQYNFLCSGKKENAYNCIFQKDNRIYGFYFEPSQELYNRILKISNNLKVA